MGRYAEIADVRAEGVTEAMAIDARVEMLLEMGARYIDRVTGLWFDLREDLTLKLDGSGRPTLELPAPLLAVTSVVADGQTIQASAYVLRNQRETDDFYWPRLEWVELPLRMERAFGPSGKYGQVWPKGQQNIVITGDWGFVDEIPGVEDDVELITPPMITRANVLLVAKIAKPAVSNTARIEGLLQSETFGNYSYNRGAAATGTLWTGDVEIDQILAAFTRVPAMVTV